MLSTDDEYFIVCVDRYNCSCKTGFEISADGITCQDIDECMEDSDGCSQQCVNTAGSFVCACDDGYTLFNG